LGEWGFLVFLVLGGVDDLGKDNPVEDEHKPWGETRVQGNNKQVRYKISNTTKMTKMTKMTKK